MLPPTAYLFSDDAHGEKPDGDWSSTLPHALPDAPGKATPAFYQLWEDTPFADAYLAKMARAAVREYGMGQGPGTDFLAVSFSTLDLVGHAFGPRSHEVQDVLLHLDASLGALLDDLDRIVGADRYVVAVTGDHGVSPIPEQMAEEGTDAGRIGGSALVARIEAALLPLIGAGPHVQTLIYTDLYFRPGVYARLLAHPDAMQAVIDAIESTPGVLRALRSDDIAAVRLGVDQLAQTALYSYAPGRSGDLLIVPKPYYLNSTSAATHGTGYRYDARVPVILMGAGIKAGHHVTTATPADIVPTLAHLTGVTMPRTDGRVLQEALAARADSGSRSTGMAGSRRCERAEPECDEAPQSVPAPSIRVGEPER
jgi:predicted AlkP superfamily pyrophosphatase or phosphodiesterase